MSLRSKILVILSCVVVLYAALDNTALRLLSGPFFGDWEQSEGRENMERAKGVLLTELDRVESVARVWARLDGVHHFVDDPDSLEGSSFALANLHRTRAVEDAGLDVLYFCDRDGTVQWSSAPEDVSLRQVLPSESLSRSNPLLNVPSGASVNRGLMMTAEAPLLVVAHPIVDAAGVSLVDNGDRFQDARNGFVIVGRFLDDELREAVKASSAIEIEILDPRRAELREGQDAFELLAPLTAREADVVTFEDGEWLTLFSIWDNHYNVEPLVLRGRMDRRITAIGRNATNYALLSTVAAALLILFVLLRLLKGIVLDPLSQLTEKAVEIGARDDTTIRVGLERSDEIGQLSSEFDRMLGRLADSRAEVVRTARMAGMSEIATGVLHNVGNVLNSVNVSANLVRRGAEKLSVDDLGRMVSVLQDNEADLGRFIAEDPRGKHFLPFLVELSETLAKQRREVLGELDSLNSGIEHISDLVRAQQTFAGTKGVFEFASLEAELESALRICAQALNNLGDVEVVRDFEELDSVKVDKHKLMEILVNLIQNAHQAMRENQGPKRLTLRLQRASETTVRIEVTDNGVGISQDNLERVFHHGFTTREDGHGFGLHVSANAATEMGGTLAARSEGAGRGATFFLDLPARVAEGVGVAA